MSIRFYTISCLKLSQNFLLLESALDLLTVEELLSISLPYFQDSESLRAYLKDLILNFVKSDSAMPNYYDLVHDTCYKLDEGRLLAWSFDNRNEIYNYIVDRYQEENP